MLRVPYPTQSARQGYSVNLLTFSIGSDLNSYAEPTCRKGAPLDRHRANPESHSDNRRHYWHASDCALAYVTNHPKGVCDMDCNDPILNLVLDASLIISISLFATAPWLL